MKKFILGLVLGMVISVSGSVMAITKPLPCVEITKPVPNQTTRLFDCVGHKNPVRKLVADTLNARALEAKPTVNTQNVSALEPAVPAVPIRKEVIPLEKRIIELEKKVEKFEERIINLEKIIKKLEAKNK